MDAYRPNRRRPGSAKTTNACRGASLKIEILERYKRTWLGTGGPIDPFKVTKTERVFHVAPPNIKSGSVTAKARAIMSMGLQQAPHVIELINDSARSECMPNRGRINGNHGLLKHLLKRWKHI
jgi:hypothetical protein